MNGNFYFRYSKSIPKEYAKGTLAGANLAYVNVPELDPTSDTGNLRVIDRSYINFPENNVLFAGSTVTFAPGTGSIVNDSYNFLLTSEYGNASENNGTTLAPINPTIPVRPLWYVHRFIDFAPDKAPSGEYSIRVFNSKGEQIPSDHYKFDSSTAPSCLYTDLINTLEEHYTIVYMSNRTEVRRLLSVEPVYNRSYASTPGDYEYVLTSNPSGDNRWLIVVGNNGIQYSLKNIGTTKISVKHPVQVTQQTDPWYIQITNGYFKHIQNGNVYEYYLPEYSYQNWKPSRPFKLQVLEKPEFIDNQTVRLKQTPLARYTDSDDMKEIHLYVRKSVDRTYTLNDNINDLINAAGNKLTTSAAATILSASSPDWDSITWQELEISDIDRNSGLVRISGLKDSENYNRKDNAIYTTDEIVACYYYIEEEYTLTGINFNPLANRDLLTGGVSIYLKPAKAYPYPGVESATLEETFIYPTTVEWLRFDEDENIVAQSASGSTFSGNIDDFYAVTNENNIPSEGNDHSKIVELARIFISPSSSIRDIVDENLIDTRIAGGNLFETLPEDVLAKVNENTYGMYPFRNWDGAVFPGNSVVVIQLPKEKLTGASSQEELNDIMSNLVNVCKKHLAAGTLPIVRFYDSATDQIVDVVPDISGNPLSAHPPIDRTLF